MADTLLTSRQHGQTVTVAVGTPLVVQLDESPTTGYAWSLVTAQEALPLTADGFEPAAPGSVGGGGLRCLHFNVRRPGDHRLELALMRPWEGAAAAIDRFAATVRAHAA